MVITIAGSRIACCSKRKILHVNSSSTIYLWKCVYSRGGQYTWYIVWRKQYFLAKIIFLLFWPESNLARKCLRQLFQEKQSSITLDYVDVLNSQNLRVCRSLLIIILVKSSDHYPSLSCWSQGSEEIASCSATDVGASVVWQRRYHRVITPHNSTNNTNSSDVCCCPRVGWSIISDGRHETPGHQHSPHLINKWLRQNP